MKLCDGNPLFSKTTYYLTIADMWREMAAHFLHEAGEATIVHALQPLAMWKVCVCWIHHSWKNIEKIGWEWQSTSLLSTRRRGNDLLEWIITSDESWIHFYEPEKKAASMGWRGRSSEKIQEWVVSGAGDINSFLGLHNGCTLN